MIIVPRSPLEDQATATKNVRIHKRIKPPERRFVTLPTYLTRDTKINYPAGPAYVAITILPGSRLSTALSEYGGCGTGKGFGGWSRWRWGVGLLGWDLFERGGRRWKWERRGGFGGFGGRAGTTVVIWGYGEEDKGRGYSASPVLLYRSFASLYRIRYSGLVLTGDKWKHQNSLHSPVALIEQQPPIRDTSFSMHRSSLSYPKYTSANIKPFFPSPIFPLIPLLPILSSPLPNNPLEGL